MLLEKLDQIGIPKNIINLLKDVFSKSTIEVNGSIINSSKGVMQGSSLSPILFNLYINDLIEELHNQNLFVRGFADDLVFGAENSQQLDIGLKIIDRW